MTTRRTAPLVAAVVLLLAACTGPAAGSAKSSAVPTTARPASPTSAATAAPAPTAGTSGSAFPAAAAGTRGELAPGSNPAVLPGPIIIADRNNNRLVVVSPQGQVLWQWPRPGDLAPGQTFRVPDDVFVTPDGKDVVATEEDVFAITEIDIATRKIVWRYGKPGHHGSGPNRLWNPDDALMLPDRSVVAADIKNCRLVDLSSASRSPLWTMGTVGSCYHAPPTYFGSPNGVFPLPDGNLLVTEINGDWVDEINRHGHVLWATHPPAIAYPSDAHRYKPGQYVTVDYSDPGQAIIFNASGKTIWRWNPSSGRGRLSYPSLAVGLPNGDILLNDDSNHRVIVIDPKTKKIVWQYGHTGHPGRGTGYLNHPDGLDPLPPFSLADTVGLTAPPKPGRW